MASEEKGLLSIGEFAKLAGTTRSKLLYYDKMGVFTPVQTEEKQDQAPNRRYAIYQLNDFRMLELLGEAGLSLSQGMMLRHGEVGARETLVLQQIEATDRLIRQLQRVRSSMVGMTKLHRLIARRGEVFETELSKDLYWRYFPVEREHTRNTAAFAKSWLEVSRLASEDDDLLPLPIAQVYSAYNVGSYYPVRGLMVPCERREKANYVIPAGRYLVFGGTNEPGKWQQAVESSRRYMVAHKVLRNTPVFGWTLSSSVVDGRVHYTECFAAGITPGTAPEGALPITPTAETVTLINQ